MSRLNNITKCKDGLAVSAYLNSHLSSSAVVVCFTTVSEVESSFSR